MKKKLYALIHSNAHLMDSLGLVPRFLEARRDQAIDSTSRAATGETGVDDVEVVKRDEPDEQEESVDDVSLASGQLLPCLQDNNSLACILRDFSMCDEVQQQISNLNSPRLRESIQRQLLIFQLISNFPFLVTKKA